MPSLSRDATARAEQAEHDATQARQAEAAATARADHAQAAAAEEAARIRADHQCALDQLTTATTARIAALEEACGALRVRAERAEADLDTARADNKRLAAELTKAADTDADTAPPGTQAPRTRTRSRKATASRPQE